MSFTTLVDVATLAAHLDDPDWLIIDVRHQLADTAYGARVYAESHIPGAFFLHCDCDLSGATTGTNGRHPLPDPENWPGGSVKSASAHKRKLSFMTMPKP